MSALSDELISDLQNWFADRPSWFQVAAGLLIDGDTFTLATPATPAEQA